MPKGNPIPTEVRFWKRVIKSDGCWIWRGSLFSNGYGKLMVYADKPPSFGACVIAHRVSWQIHHGNIPDGLWVLHRCDNRACVNPDHLFLGTRQENMDDMKAKFRQTFGEGHPAAKLTDEDIRDIRKRFATGETHRQISLSYPVNRETIGRIVRHQSWWHIGA